jgi:hypothetical protein
MKKYKIYILIMFVFWISTFGMVFKVNADTTPPSFCPQAAPTDPTQVTGTCNYGSNGNGGVDLDTHSSAGECIPGQNNAVSFTPDTYGDCILPSGTTNSCWPRTSCVENNGTFTGYYNLLQPLPQVGPFFDANNAEQPNSLGRYLNPMITVFIGICAVLAVIMILMGGIQYMGSELISSKEEGKERIRNAIFGLILALGAYTLLYTINPNLLKSDISSAPSVNLSVDIGDDTPQTPVNGKFTAGTSYSGGGVAGASWDTTRESLPYSDNNGLVAKIYNSECSTIGQTGCTSSEDLSLAYIDTIEGGCGKPCLPLKVQGGTEYWLHGGSSGSTTHHPNSPTIDLGPTTALTNYIMTGNPATSGTAPAFHGKYTRDGITYYWETSHWHTCGSANSC